MYCCSRTDSSSHCALVCLLYNIKTMFCWTFWDLRFLQLPAVGCWFCAVAVDFWKESKPRASFVSVMFLHLKYSFKKRKGLLFAILPKFNPLKSGNWTDEGQKEKSVVFHSWPPDVCQPGHLSSRQRGPRSRTPPAPPPLRNQCPRKRFQPGLEPFFRNSEL